MRQPAYKIDREALKNSRLRAGYTRRDLGQSAGLTVPAVAHLESPGRDRITVERLARIAEAIGVHPGDLLTPARGAQPQPDDVVVEAMLAEAKQQVFRDHLGRALGWPPERTRDAIEALRARLMSTGQRLVESQFGWYGLRSATEVIDDEAVAVMRRELSSARGLKPGSARHLLKVVRGQRVSLVPPKREHRQAIKRSAQRSLLVEGLVEAAGSVPRFGETVKLSDDVAFSLFLTDERGTPSCRTPPPARMRSHTGTRTVSRTNHAKRTSPS